MLALAPSATSAQDRVPVTNLRDVAPGVGLPDGWDLRTTRAAAPPLFAVTGDGALRVETRTAAGFAIYQLPERIPPEPGRLVWRWRTAPPIPDADLRDRSRDDSPVRVLVVFADRRMLFYSWSGQDTVVTAFRSWTGRSRGVVPMRSPAAATGEWHTECRDPLIDYARIFDRAPPAIVAVGVSADTDQLAVSTWAEVDRLSWIPGSADSGCAPESGTPH